MWIFFFCTCDLVAINNIYRWWQWLSQIQEVGIFLETILAKSTATVQETKIEIRHQATTLQPVRNNGSTIVKGAIESETWE